MVAPVARLTAAMLPEGEESACATLPPTTARSAAALAKKGQTAAVPAAEGCCVAWSPAGSKRRGFWQSSLLTGAGSGDLDAWSGHPAVVVVGELLEYHGTCTLAGAGAAGCVLSGRGTEKGKWVWHASRTAHPYYRKHSDAIRALIIETDARSKYPSHEQKKAALLSIDGLVLHELPAQALAGEAKDEMELATQTQIEELEKKAGSSKVRKVAEAVAEDKKAKGKAISEDPKAKGKAASEDPKAKGKAVADDEDEDGDGEAEEGFEVGNHVVLYCVVETLVNDPEYLPTGYYHEKGKSATWTADMPLLTGVITHTAGSPYQAAHGLKSATAKRKSATALHLNGEYCGIKVLSLAVDKEDVAFDNAPLLFSAWQSGIQMAFVGMEKLYGKALKANDKIAGPGGLGSQLLAAMAEKTYPFGDKSKWSLVVPTSHLRPIFKENLHRAYETTNSEAGSLKGDGILPSASEDDADD
ncbi:hypothetical protein CYMTET_33928 [Cymbomonas tetramitiformis]|uniref:Uncharacterized protein n=1 Tax=Cymbomonas tetramitiformis TaxID=36881 RepID=A0AAE0KQQ4_9CHLO|nr:hypothetical protein CYMTET_33928 [Cymbomonas tetramitiformis]